MRLFAKDEQHLFIQSKPTPVALPDKHNRSQSSSDESDNEKVMKKLVQSIEEPSGHPFSFRPGWLANTR